MIQAIPAERILSGVKTWEIRGSRTEVRGKIALLVSGTGTAVGTCEIVDVVGPLTLAELKSNARRLGVRAEAIRRLHYRTTYAWVVREPKRLRRPVTYRHPQGAVIWVRLSPSEARRIEAGARMKR